MNNTNKTTIEPMAHLVNCQHGVYNYQILLSNYSDNIYVLGPKGYMLFTDFLNWCADYPNDTIDTIFNPDNEDYCENIDHIEWAYPLHILNSDDGLYYRVECIEGDLWAIHPEAEYCEEEDTYKLRGEKC